MDGWYEIECWGGDGYFNTTAPVSQSLIDANLGYGSYVKGRIHLTHGTTLYVGVGENRGSADVRTVYTSALASNINSLRSRIIVASGGADGAYFTEERGAIIKGADGGCLIGENGSTYVAFSDTYIQEPPAVGATQTCGGIGTVGNDANVIGRESETHFKTSRGGFGTFGVNQMCYYYGQLIGGNTVSLGYYSGAISWGNGCWGTASSATSFISGYSGCNAVASYGGNELSMVHTNQPNHYSGYIFDNMLMMSGGARYMCPDGSYNKRAISSAYVRCLLTARD